MAILSRTDRQTAALVDLLRALPERQLVDVLDRVGATLNTPTGDTDRPVRPCGVCGRVYPVCRALYADDHNFEQPRQPGAGVPAPATVKTSGGATG